MKSVMAQVRMIEGLFALKNDLDTLPYTEYESTLEGYRNLRDRIIRESGIDPTPYDLMEEKIKEGKINWSLS